MMNNIALSLTELQSIADYLAGNTGGGSGGGTGGGGGTIDGQALYTSNCAACHGADAATINDPSVSGITAAMTSIGSMTGITLNTAEIQAIADYLAGGSGGGTGGGSGGLPSNHTNSEEGVLHADGNNNPYTNGCTACHGSTLQGAIGPSCFACHGQEWNESPPSGGSSGGDSGTLDGQTLYTANCSGCHGADGSGINGTSVSAITDAMNTIGIMNGVSVSAAELQAISDFLTGSSGGGGSGGGGGTGTVDGASLYASNCAACHGATGSNINANTASGITTALNNIGSMNSLSLTTEEIQALPIFLVVLVVVEPAAVADQQMGKLCIPPTVPLVMVLLVPASMPTRPAVLPQRSTISAL
jgi:mono/diheme cytochrome c family protein